MNDGFMSDPRRQAMLAMGLGMMANSGPAPVRQGLFPIIGQAGMGALGLYNNLIQQRASQAFQQRELELKEQEVYNDAAYQKAALDQQLKIEDFKARQKLAEEAAKQKQIEGYRKSVMSAIPTLAASLGGDAFTPQQHAFLGQVAAAPSVEGIATAAKGLFEPGATPEYETVWGGALDDPTREILLQREKGTPGAYTPVKGVGSRTRQTGGTTVKPFEMSNTLRGRLDKVTQSGMERLQFIDRALNAIESIRKGDNTAAKKTLDATLAWINDSGSRALEELIAQRGASYGGIVQRTLDQLKQTILDNNWTDATTRDIEVNLINLMQDTAFSGVGSLESFIAEPVDLMRAEYGDEIANKYAGTTTGHVRTAIEKAKNRVYEWRKRLQAQQAPVQPPGSVLGRGASGSW